MKASVLFLSLILLCCTLPSAGIKKHADYADYFRGILKAEHELANGDLPAALHAYKAVFEAYDFVFARDAYNALQVSLAGAGHPHQDSFLLRCAMAGVPQELLKKNALVHAAYQHEEGRFLQLYANGYAVYLQRIDTTLRAEMKRRFDREQANKGNQNYKDICTDNFNRVKELARQGRFPAEQVVGVDRDMNYGLAFPTLLHYPYAYVQRHDYLWAAVHKGQLQPLSLIYLYSFNQTGTSVLYTDSVPVDTQHFKTSYNVGVGLQSADEAAVDSARRTVWLRPVAEKQRITVVAQKHGIDFREGW